MMHKTGIVMSAVDDAFNRFKRNVNSKLLLYLINSLLHCVMIIARSAITCRKLLLF